MVGSGRTIVRPFLSLAGYYRGFIKDIVFFPKPLTDLRKNVAVSESRSKRTIVGLNMKQLNVFHKLKVILSSGDVLLLYPYYFNTFYPVTMKKSRESSNMFKGNRVFDRGKKIGELVIN